MLEKRTVKLLYEKKNWKQKADLAEALAEKYKKKYFDTFEIDD